MQAFNDLRQAARDRRDKLIAKARTEYEATIAKIASIEQDLLEARFHGGRSQHAMANVTPLTDPSIAVHPIGIKGCPTDTQIAASVVVAKPATPTPASIAEILHLHTDARGLEEKSSKRRGEGEAMRTF